MTLEEKQGTLRDFGTAIAEAKRKGEGDGRR